MAVAVRMTRSQWLSLNSITPLSSTWKKSPSFLPLYAFLGKRASSAKVNIFSSPHLINVNKCHEIFLLNGFRESARLQAWRITFLCGFHTFQPPNFDDVCIKYCKMLTLQGRDPLDVNPISLVLNSLTFLFFHVLLFVYFIFGWSFMPVVVDTVPNCNITIITHPFSYCTIKAKSWHQSDINWGTMDK